MYEQHLKTCLTTASKKWTALKMCTGNPEAEYLQSLQLEIGCKQSNQNANFPWPSRTFCPRLLCAGKRPMWIRPGANMQFQRALHVQMGESSLLWRPCEPTIPCLRIHNSISISVHIKSFVGLVKAWKPKMAHKRICRILQAQNSVLKAKGSSTEILCSYKKHCKIFQASRTWTCHDSPEEPKAPSKYRIRTQSENYNWVLIIRSVPRTPTEETKASQAETALSWRQIGVGLQVSSTNTTPAPLGWL